jgi:hypothetical protein
MLGVLGDSEICVWTSRLLNWSWVSAITCVADTSFSRVAFGYVDLAVLPLLLADRLTPLLSLHNSC